MHLECPNFQLHWSKLGLEGTPWIDSMSALGQLCDNEDRSHSIAKNKKKSNQQMSSLAKELELMF